MSGFISKCLFLVLFIWFQLVSGQVGTQPDAVEERPKIYLDGHQYPSFGDGSHYGWFELHFPLMGTNEVSVGGEHYRNYFADRFNVPIKLRQYISEKTYVLGGYQMEWDLLNGGLGYPNPTPMQETFFGVGYEVKENMFLEAKYVQPLNESKFGKIGYGRNLPRLQLGGKWKF
ncbi:MAG: hypothetical protein AAGJ12_07515 [Bacteroidota bacterium]